MPLKAGKLRTDHRKVKFAFADEEVNVTYNAGAITPKMVRECFKGDDETGVEAALKQLTLFIVEWDVMEENGKPLAVTDETLSQLPTAFLKETLKTIWESYNPNLDRPETSFG